MKSGRNDPCPCKSGKKYKSCCWKKERPRSRLQNASVLSGGMNLFQRVVADSPDHKKAMDGLKSRISQGAPDKTDS